MIWKGLKTKCVSWRRTSSDIHPSRRTEAGSRRLFQREREMSTSWSYWNGLEDGSITFYEQGDFVDLCRGPHIPDTGRIKNPKLLNIAGAYWRGDQSRAQLTRLYGITFPKKKELDEYLERLELARQRDHRKLGKELELFTFSDKVGPGLPMWLPKGAILTGNAC